MACLPFYPRSPYKGDVFALLFSCPVHIAPPISKWLARPLPHSLSPGYRNKPRTHIQGQFSLTVRKLAHYTGSDCPLLHSKKPYSPFILSRLEILFQAAHRPWHKLGETWQSLLVQILLSVSVSLETSTLFAPGIGKSSLTWGFCVQGRWVRGKVKVTLPFLLLSQAPLAKKHLNMPRFHILG